MGAGAQVDFRKAGKNLGGNSPLRDADHLGRLAFALASLVDRRRHYSSLGPANLNGFG